MGWSTGFEPATTGITIIDSLFLISLNNRHLKIHCLTESVKLLYIVSITYELSIQKVRHLDLSSSEHKKRSVLEYRLSPSSRYFNYSICYVMWCWDTAVGKYTPFFMLPYWKSYVVFNTFMQKNQMLLKKINGVIFRILRRPPL